MSETSAAKLNFGPAWLRDTLSSEANPVSGFHLLQPLSKSSSATSSYTAFPSSSGLATAKLAEFRYGREEMLALYSSDHSPPLTCQVKPSPKKVYLHQQWFSCRSVSRDVTRLPIHR
jgi:hypothetical protein